MTSLKVSSLRHISIYFLAACGTISMLLAITVYAGEAFAADVTGSLKVDLKDGLGRIVGSAEFVEIGRHPLFVTIRVSHLPPGEHRVSIHGGYPCEPPAFKSVGSLLGRLSPLPDRYHSKHISSYGTVAVDKDGNGVANLNSNLSITNMKTTVLGHTIVVDDNRASAASGDSTQKLACGDIPSKCLLLRTPCK